MPSTTELTTSERLAAIERVLRHHHCETKWDGDVLLVLLFEDNAPEWVDCTDWTIGDLRIFLQYS